jgi:hypothetical protein
MPKKHQIGQKRKLCPSDRSAKLIDTLGSTDSGSIDVHLKPFSTSILRSLVWVIATVTKICTKDRSKLTHASSSLQSSRSLTRSNVMRRVAEIILANLSLNNSFFFERVYLNGQV